LVAVSGAAAAFHEAYLGGKGNRAEGMTGIHFEVDNIAVAERD
jgi:hypothetical protein